MYFGLCVVSIFHFECCASKGVSIEGTVFIYGNGLKLFFFVFSCFSLKEEGKKKRFNQRIKR